MMGTHHGKAAFKRSEEVDIPGSAHTPTRSANLLRLPIEQPTTPLDDNLWKLIIGSYIGPDDFRSMLFTCRYWGYYYGRDERLREKVIANRTEIITIIYTDSNCSEISKKERQPARAPGRTSSMFAALSLFCTYSKSHLKSGARWSKSSNGSLLNNMNVLVSTTTSTRPSSWGLRKR